MVHIRVLSGRKAGTELVTRHFPVRIGRAANATIQLEDAGVWDEHLRIDFKHREGYFATAGAEAPVRVNDEPQQRTLLRNGDTVAVGSVRLQFWLAGVAQRRLGYRETFTWVLVALVCALQVALVYLLIQL